MQRLLCAGLLLLAALTPTSATPSPLVDPHDLMALRSLADGESAVALSPDGGALAVFETTIDVEANRYQNDLILIDLPPGHSTRRIGDGGDIILSATGGRRTGRSVARVPAWSTDGEAIAYLANRDSRVELWTSTRDGRAARVASLPGDVRDFFWSADNILYAETATPRAMLDAVRAGHMRYGFRVDEHFGPGYGVLPRLDDTTETQFWRIDNGAEEVSRAAFEDARRRLAIRRAWIGAIDPTATVATPALGVFVGSVAAPKRCDHPACSGALVDAWRNADASLVLFTRLEGHGRALSALYQWRPDDDAVRLLRRGDERITSCAIQTEAYCLQESATQPRRLIAISLATGSSRDLYDPNPQWRTRRDWRVERLETTNDDGEESFAHLVYPRDYRRGRRYPLVIVQYLSRGFLRGGVGGETPIYPLAARGYFVLSVDRPEPRGLYARMSADAVLRQTELDGSEISMKLEAIERLIQDLSARRLIDEDRIAITGMSDGAETLYAALLGQRHFAVAVAASQPRDPSAYWLAAETHVSAMQNQIGYRPPWDDSDPLWRTWWAQAPFLNAERIRTPLMLNLAESEVLYAAPLIRRLRERNAELETFVYPGAYHIKWLPSHLAASQERSMAWIDFWLCGRTPTDAILAASWNEMRQRVAPSAASAVASGRHDC